MCLRQILCVRCILARAPAHRRPGSVLPRVSLMEARGCLQGIFRRGGAGIDSGSTQTGDNPQGLGDSNHEIQVCWRGRITDGKFIETPVAERGRSIRRHFFGIPMRCKVHGQYRKLNFDRPAARRGNESRQ